MKKYYASKIEDVLENLDSNTNDGLTSDLVKIRQERDGLNVLPHKKQDSVFKIFFKQMLDPIVLLLVVTIIFSLIIGEYIDAIAIIFSVFVVLGTFQ